MSSSFSPYRARMDRRPPEPGRGALCEGRATPMERGNGHNPIYAGLWIKTWEFAPLYPQRARLSRLLPGPEVRFQHLQPKPPPARRLGAAVEVADVEQEA